jgi:glycosyltransferase involved in cell wall biosynthesis
MPLSTLALCVPAYNAAWCLPRLLKSALDQTAPFDEMLVYDDCSTDETAAVALHFGATVIRGEINRGCSVGKNRLAGATSCAWLHFHDADDLLLPNFVEVAKRRIEVEDAADVILLNFEYRDHSTDDLLGGPAYDVKLMRLNPTEFVLRHKVVNFGIYRKDSFLYAGGFDEDPAVLYNEDAALHYRLALAGLSFDYECELTCVNYRYDRSMSASNQGKCSRAEFHVLKKTAAVLHGQYDELIAAKLWRAAGVAASHLDWETAVESAALARQLGGRIPPDGNAVYKVLAQLNPALALRIREHAIRCLRPDLRSRQRSGEADA